MKINRFRIQNGIGISLFSMVMLLVGILMYRKLDLISANFTKHQLKVQSTVVANVIRQQMKSELDNLDFLARYMELNNMSWKDVATISGIQDDSIGIITLDGKSLFGRSFNPKKFKGISRSFHGTPAISFFKDEGLLFTVPVYNKKNVKYVAFKFIDYEKLENYFYLNFYDGVGKVAVMTRNLDVIYTDASNVGDILEDEDIQKGVAKLQNSMLINTSAATLTKFEGKYCFSFVSEVPETDFIVAGLIPYKLVSEGINNISRLFMYVFGLLFVLFIICLIFIAGEERKLSDTKQLEEEKYAAEQANSAKSDFLANMSHEIRTPINSILGMNEMILRESEDASIRSYAQDIYSAGQGLLAIINDILDFSKIEAGKMEIVPVTYEVCSMLNDVTNMIGVKAKSKHLDFIVDVDTKLPSRLKGDPVRIQQILINILNNAVKYTNEGFIRLAVKQKSWNKDMITIQIDVQDSGIGIKPEDKEKLFSSFQRFDLQKNRTVEGTGLGLAITKRLANCMGGEILLESVYGSGSTFTVTLPQQVVDFTPVGNFKERFEKFKQSEEKHQKTFTAPNAKILIVDDNAMNLHVAKSLLKQTMMQVSLCSSGKECLELLRSEHFDIIFLDHMMPDMDGIETLNAIKLLEKNCSAGSPVIALTANAIVGVKEMYIKAGFTDYLSKPIEGKVFEAMIQSYLPASMVIPVSKEIAMNTHHVEREVAPEFVNHSVESKSEVSQPEISQPEAVSEEKNDLINQEKGLVYCGGDMDTYKEIVQVYIDEAPENVKKLRDYLGGDDIKNYVIIAHAVKSTSLTIGAEGLSAVAKEQEFAGKEERIAELMEKHDTFLDLYMKVVEKAKEIVSE